MLIAFNKPYGVLSQFTGDGSPNRTLAEFGFPARVYAIGRLDADSEGLLLLSDEPALNARLLQPFAGASARLLGAGGRGADGGGAEKTLAGGHGAGAG